MLFLHTLHLPCFSAEAYSEQLQAFQMEYFCVSNSVTQKTLHLRCLKGFWQWNRGIDLVAVIEYTFFQLCFNAEQISVRLARFKRSYVYHPAVVQTNHTSYTPFLLDVRCTVERGHVSFFCSCLSPVVVHLRNLFLLRTSVVRILLTPRWVSRRKDVK